MAELCQIRVVLADRSALIQAGVRSILQPFADIRLVGVAGLWGGGDLCDQLCPDVLLIDLALTATDIFESIRRIKQRQRALRVVVLTSLVDGELVRRALAVGVSGYLLKDVSCLDLVAALRGSLVGRLVIAPEATEALVSVVSRDEDAELLSRREREVLRLVTQGLSNNLIADQLCISRSTVKYHVSRIFEKLGVTSRAQVIALAHQLRLVPPPDDPLRWQLGEAQALTLPERVEI